MDASKVYFTDFRTPAYGDSILKKLQKLMLRAGFADLDLDGKFVAIKMHFGEKGNISFLRPNWARAVVDMVKQQGGKPFLTDCNTMYPGSRKNALEHLYCAWENGFTPLSVGCPVIIADGLKGTDDIEVEVKGGDRQGHYGCRCNYKPDSFQRPRDDRVRRHNQEPGNGIGLKGR